jgi:hypothetical protein
LLSIDYKVCFRSNRWLFSFSAHFLSSLVAIMGQRHQAFVIARVIRHKETQPKYRCIAAVHHQWCYGRLPLRATRRLLTLVKQKDNAEIIRSEIRSIDGMYGAGNQQPKVPKIPCPYTAFLLATAWTTDLENPEDIYTSGTTFKNDTLHAGMRSGGGGEFGSLYND